jgi:hypothetical protein
MVISSLGTNHADEITLSPEPIAQDALPMTAGNGAMPQPVIEPFTNELIRRALDALSLPNGRDEDGDWFTVIPGGDGRSHLLCYFIEARKMFHMICLFDAHIPKRKWGQALTLCNTYHAKLHFGRAFLLTQEGQEDATLRFEAAIDCTAGLSQEFLQTFISSHIASACLFYEMAHEDKALGLTRSTKLRQTNNHKGVASTA